MSGVEIATGLLSDFTEIKVKELLEKRKWMEGKKFILLTKIADIEQYIDHCIEKGLCVLDLETTGLNTRINKEGESCSKIVGMCLATNADEGVYIPVAHEDKEFNVPLKLVLREIARLCANCRCIFHNFKFDGQMLRNYGIVIEDDDKYEDTYLMAAIWDASLKPQERGLKFLVEKFIGREMIEINELGIEGSKKNTVAFDMVPPQKAVYYGASDGMCTFALYEFLKAKIDEQDPTGKKGPWAIYGIEKRCMFVTMEMERSLAKIDRAYFEKCKEDVIDRMNKLVTGIYNIAGREFDVNSPKQLGTLLFEELKIPYPIKEKTKTGLYITSEKILELLEGKYPIIDMILTYRGYGKVMGTYIENFLKNADENEEVKFSLNQIGADTGRYSASGGQGLNEDGYSGVNCENIPNYDPDNPNSVNLRKGVIARPGYKMVSIDYSGEELRIAANYSREPKWIDEFLNGTGDLHTKTAQAVTGKQKVSKMERRNSKTLNFHILYGGGAGGFAARAKLPYHVAKKMLIDFFREYSSLKRWIDKEAKAAKLRGYSLTALGRRRPLGEFYNNPDPKIAAKGDRCAINSQIQGCLQSHERVLTTKGYLSIKEVSDIKKERESIKVWTGNEWANFSVVDRGTAQFAKIVLSNGMSLDCDTRHEVLVVGSRGYVFKKYDELTEKDNICVSIPTVKEFGEYPENFRHSGGIAHNSKAVIVKGKNNWDFVGYLLGYAIGDGTLRFGDKESVTLSFGITKLIRNEKFIRKGIQNIGLVLNKARKSKKSRGESYTCSIDSKALVALFKYMGHTYKGARSKRVPNKIHTCPVSMRKEFLRGIFDTDCSKKPNNRYSYHTPNLELLRDIQLLGWTLGLSSIICENKSKTYTLHWSDLATFEKFLGLSKVSCLKKRTAGKMRLPVFLYDRIYNYLKNCGILMKNQNDKTLLCKLHKNKPITVQTALRLLDDYGIKQSDIYFHYPLKRKIILKEFGNTYTLSVENPSHRFDSAGIISKNTGADLIKIALYRVWKWIRDSGLQNDIRILAPIHDEILFEVKEDKIDALIPEMCNIMRLPDITKALKWPVPLDVDAEYGDSFYVDHNFWEEQKEKQKMTPVETPKPESTETPVDRPPVAPPVETLPQPEPDPVEEIKPIIIKEVQEKKNDNVSVISVVMSDKMPSTVTASDMMPYFYNVTVKKSVTEGVDKKKDIQDILNQTEVSKDSKPAFQDAHIKDRIDERGYFNYPLEIDSISARKLKFIFDTLVSAGDNVFIGPKYKVCLLSKEGEVYFRSSEIVAIDAFVALCLAFNI
jgi:DNA polymerase I-like protein with 3'-5' exonuclease and polymerase domains